MVSLARPSRTSMPPQWRLRPMSCFGAIHPISPVSIQPSLSSAASVEDLFCLRKELNNKKKTQLEKQHIHQQILNSGRDIFIFFIKVGTTHRFYYY